MSLDHGWCGCKSRPGLVWLETTNPDLGWVSGVVGGRGWGYEVGLGGLIGMAWGGEGTSSIVVGLRARKRAHIAFLLEALKSSCKPIDASDIVF